MIYCTMEHQQEMTIGDLLQAIEDILRKPDAFTYPIEYVSTLVELPTAGNARTSRGSRVTVLRPPGRGAARFFAKGLGH
jgi:hypothetical protein